MSLSIWADDMQKEKGAYVFEPAGRGHSRGVLSDRLLGGPSTHSSRSTSKNGPTTSLATS
jgi:hypothetical protein